MGEGTRGRRNKSREKRRGGLGSKTRMGRKGYTQKQEAYRLACGIRSG